MGMIERTTYKGMQKYPMENEIPTGGYLYPSDSCIDVSDYERGGFVKIKFFHYVVVGGGIE